MTGKIKHLTDFLVGLGPDKVAHSGEHFLAHLIAVYRDLESWGCEEAVCLGGMFHSIYGTEQFQRFSLPLERRGEVRELIGERAERLAYLNSAMDRASFDTILEVSFDTIPENSRPFCMVDRFTGEAVTLTPREFEDLCTIHLCDWLEQLPRSKTWDYRRDAYRRLAEHLCGVARESYERVFALEPT